MSSRTLNMVAIFLGVGAMLALGAFSLRPKPPRLEVRSQTVQQVAGRGRCVVIEVSGPRRRDGGPFAGGRGLRIVDGSGRQIGFEIQTEAGWGTEPSLLVRMGYRQPILDPRLELWRDDRRVAWTRLAPFPAPLANDLRPSERPLFRCALRQYSPNSPIMVNVVPTKPLPEDEAWTIHLVATRHAEGLDAWASLLPDTPGGTDLEVPYAEEAEMVEVEIHRFRGVAQTESALLPNLALVDANGQTALSVGRTRDLGEHFGVGLLLLESTMGIPSPRKPEPDRRRPYGFLIPKGSAYRPPPRSPVEPPPMVRVRLVVPDFLRLNVRSLGFSLDQAGLQSAMLQRADDPKGPVSRKPFDADLRFSRTTWRSAARVRQVVMIDPRGGVEKVDRMRGFAAPAD